MTLGTRLLRVSLLAAAVVFAQMAAVPAPAQAAEEINIVNGAAVHGYDVVAYFTAGKPTPGKAEFTAQHEGATYRFSNAANRDKFKADPAKYAPQFGGFCALGTAMGRKFDGDPNAWTIVDGKLYLNLNPDVQTKWKSNIPGFLKGANNNWPIIRSVADKQLEAGAPKGVTMGPQ